MKRRILRSVGMVIVAVSAAVAGAPAGASTGGGSDPVTGAPPDGSADADDDEVVHSWALVPAGPRGGTSTRPDFSYSGAPGTVIEDAVTLMNLGNADLPFRLYATDAFNNDDGLFSLFTADQVPTDVGSWVDLDLDSMFLDAGREVTIPFTVTIPEDAVAGDHSGGVVASSPTVGSAGDGQSVTIDRRIATRLFVRVIGPVEPVLAVTDVRTRYRHAADPLSGSASVAFRIENRGNVRLRGESSVTVEGPLGQGRREGVVVEFDELLPGEGFDATVVVEDVPALFLLRTTVEVNGVELAGGEEIGAISRTARDFAPPVTLLLVLLVVLFSIVGWRSYRRHVTTTDETGSPGRGSHSP